MVYYKFVIYQIKNLYLIFSSQAQVMIYARFSIFICFYFFITSVFAEENHQDNNNCKSRKTMDEQNYCLAMAHKDGTNCEAIKAYEKRAHCLHVIADFSHHSFNSYTPIKKSEEAK